MSTNGNFHNYIAIPLEKLTDKMGKQSFTANEIEMGSFVEAMLDILSVDPKKLPQYAVFYSKCCDYLGKRKADIPDNEATTLYDTFKAIIDK